MGLNDIAIVIVSYNTRDLLCECIDSITSETRSSHEIIVVDNASSDNTMEMLKTRYPAIKRIGNKSNAGFASANNQGFQIANGRYFLMLNPDTLVIDGAIDKLKKFMDDHPDIGICGPKNIDSKGGLQHNCDHFPGLISDLSCYLKLNTIFTNSRIFNRSQMKYWDYGSIQRVDRLMGCSMMVRSELYRLMHGLDERFFMYFEETDFCRRAASAGYPAFFYPDADIVHYGGQSVNPRDTAAPKTALKFFLPSKYYFFRKHHGITVESLSRVLDLIYGCIVYLKNNLKKIHPEKNDQLKLAREYIYFASKKHTRIRED